MRAVSILEKNRLTTRAETTMTAEMLARFCWRLCSRFPCSRSVSSTYTAPVVMPRLTMGTAAVEVNTPSA